MRFSHLLAAAVAAFGISTASAKAADWTGFYVGVMGGISAVSITECGPSCDTTAFNVGKVVGYNWDNGDTIFSLEEWVVNSTISEEDPADYTKLTWQKLARFGWEVGDSALIYAAAGGGIQALWVLGGYEGSALFAAIAAGAELKVSEQLSLRGHAQFSFAPDAGGSSATAASIAGGLIFHFN